MSTMDHLYAVGVSIISFLQHWLVSYEGFFKIVNEISDPRHLTDWWFPLVSVVDSVFASQLLLCMAFGGWLTSVLKWWLLEDRPYWWVQDTSYYSEVHRPVLRQTSQTCETGPGSPSGHTSSAAMALLLVFMWINNIMIDREIYIRWWKYAVYPLFALAMIAVMLARMFMAAHFPHQCLFGAFVGSLLAPTLCVYVSDPYIWQYGPVSKYPQCQVMYWHIVSTIVTTLIAMLTYYSLRLCGWQPSWSVKLAFRYCHNPDTINKTTLPISTLMYCTASLLGWALFVSPEVANYRYYTKHRSILISLVLAFAFLKFYQVINDLTCMLDIRMYYLIQFLITVCKPGLFLRFMPYVSRFPYHCIICCERFLKRRKLA